MTEADIQFTKNRSAELVIASDCIYVNATALKMFAKAENVIIGVDVGNCKLILHPCRDGKYEAVRWRSAKVVSPISRHILSHDLVERLFALMNRPRESRCKIVGSIAENGDERLLLFDLTAASSYIPAKINTNKNSLEETKDESRPYTEFNRNSGVVS